MRYLRTVSTQRLLAIIAAAVIVAVGATAIAVAAEGSGPVPRPATVAGAVHRALSAPAVTGISARITFTDNLIESTDIQGTDPLLTGASGRLWLSPGHLRIELQSDNGDGQIVYDNGAVWVYDPSSNTVYKGAVSAGSQAGHNRSAHTVPTVATIQSDLDKLAAHLDGLGAATPTDVAGRPAYSVRVTPKRDGGLLGAVQIAWDAVHGVPLRFAVYAAGDSTPVLALSATDISYGTVPASDFAITPPSGAKVVQVSTPAHADERRGARAAHLSFAVQDPATLAGYARTAVRLMHGAALVTYGTGLAGVAVLERAAGKGSAALPTGGGNGPLSLPTVSIGGVSGQQLETELGTAVQFTRGGVSYVVIGSVSAATADAAARAL